MDWFYWKGILEFFDLFIGIYLVFQIEMDEADLTLGSLGCSYERGKVALCPPAIMYTPYYIFTRYPQEATRVWNLVKLLTPTSWFWSFASICLSASMLKLFTHVGSILGCGTAMQDVTLVPFR